MNESKRMSQWFVWFVIVLLLMITSSLYCTPLIGQAMFMTNPFADLYGWRMVVAGVCSLATGGWWLGRGQYYERTGKAWLMDKKSLEKIVKKQGVLL